MQTQMKYTGNSGSKSDRNCIDWSIRSFDGGRCLYGRFSVGSCLVRLVLDWMLERSSLARREWRRLRCEVASVGGDDCLVVVLLVLEMMRYLWVEVTLHSCLLWLSEVLPRTYRYNHLRQLMRLAWRAPLGGEMRSLEKV